MFFCSFTGMNFNSIYTELKKCGTDKNVAIFKSQGAKGDLFGVSIADLERLKNEVNSSGEQKGVNHNVAQKLWNTRNIDARILACMVADPAKINRNEANKWVSVIQYYAIADYFAKVIAQTRFGLDIMYLWIQSPDEYIKRVGFAILDYFASNDKSRSDLFFNAFIQKIKQEIQTSPNWAKDAMKNCLASIAARNEALKKNVILAAQSIGAVEISFSESDTKKIAIEDYIIKHCNKK